MGAKSDFIQGMIQAGHSAPSGSVEDVVREEMALGLRGQQGHESRRSELLASTDLGIRARARAVDKAGFSAENFERAVNAIGGDVSLYKFDEYARELAESWDRDPNREVRVSLNGDYLKEFMRAELESARQDRERNNREG